MFSTKSSDESPSPKIPNFDLPQVKGPPDESDGMKTTTVLEVETPSEPASTSLEPTFLLRESGSTHEVASPSVPEPLPAYEPESIVPIWETAVPSIQLAPESELLTTVPAELPDAGPAS